MYSDIYFKSLYRSLQHFVKNGSQIDLWKTFEPIAGKACLGSESGVTVLAQCPDFHRSHKVSFQSVCLAFCDGSLCWAMLLGFGAVFRGLTLKIWKNRTKKYPSALSRLSRKLKNNYVWPFPSLQLRMSGGVLFVVWGRSYLPTFLLPSAVLSVGLSPLSPLWSCLQPTETFSLLSTEKQRIIYSFSWILPGWEKVPGWQTRLYSLLQ